MSKPLFANIPAELAPLPRFVLWRKEPRVGGEAPTKIPYDAKNHRRAKSNDPSTWATLAVVRAAFERSHGHYAGIGFVLGDDAPYFGVDLDDCRDPDTGTIALRARRIISHLATYAEVSPSLGGVKLIGKGSMPTPDGAGKNYRKDPWGTGAGGIEMYRRGRFFTITGNRLDGTPAGIHDGTEALARLHHELYPAPRPRPRAASPDTGRTNSPDDRVRRCAAYLDRIPASIAGNRGHDQLLHAACLTLRFGLPDADALALLQDYNRRADPPWDERDVERKLSEARKKVGGDFGSMLIDRGRPVVRAAESHRPHQFFLIGGVA